MVFYLFCWRKLVLGLVTTLFQNSKLNQLQGKAYKVKFHQLLQIYCGYGGPISSTLCPLRGLHIRSSREEKMAEEYVDFVSQTSTPNAITLGEVQTAARDDKTL